MKTDNLEQFILDNRKGFDMEQPGQKVWDGIKKRHPETKSISLNWKTLAVRAAAVVVIFVSSYYFHDFMDSRQNKTANVADVGIVNNQLYRDFLEAELYYSSEINYKQKELFQLTGNSPDLQKQVDLEMENLDNLFRQLKEDLNDNADNNEVIEAMIQNYRIKLEILEDILFQIKSENSKHQNNEKTHNTI
jgi:hypothetical protein